MICQQAEELVDYLMVEYPFSRQVWGEIEIFHNIRVSVIHEISTEKTD